MPRPQDSHGNFTGQILDQFEAIWSRHWRLVIAMILVSGVLFFIIGHDDCISYGFTSSYAMYQAMNDTIPMCRCSIDPPAMLASIRIKGENLIRQDRLTVLVQNHYDR